jgi:hypothetical protein
LSVDPKTINHLRIAERNRDLARALLSPALSGLRPSPWEWVAVMAFYAAVHGVNAYLWETRRYAPSTHGDRSMQVQYDLRINRCRQGYIRLSFVGYHARYTETYGITEQYARTLLEVHFRRVEATVMQALGQPVPVW